MTAASLRTVIIGATSAMAEQCARRWVLQGQPELVLVGRDLPRCEAVAADLRVRNPRATIRVETVDFHSPQDIAGLVDRLGSSQPVDRVLIAQGWLPDQAQCEQNLHQVHQALQVNAVSPALFAESFVGHMEKIGQGTIGIIGSVAGDRGRKSNYVYGSAKGLIERYAQGLQHRLAGSRVRVVLIKPGPTSTPMTAHLVQQGARMASVDDVAEQICRAMDRGVPVVYTPAKWALIMMIIRHLPRMVFNRLDI